MERLSPLRRTRGGLLALGAALAAVTGVILAAVFGGPGQAGADPPGNNGTVKVDGVVFDDDPNNEPHVDCIFQIDWYGFDEGDFLSHVTFEVHPPTGKPVILLEDDVFIGEDDKVAEDQRPAWMPRRPTT